MTDDRADTLQQRSSLSFAQQRLWFLDRYEAGHPVFQHALLLRLTGSLNLEALERSLAEIVSRHNVLRARFALVSDHPVLMIGPPAPPSLAVVDLTSLPAAGREAEALRLATLAANRLFDLDTGPLFRAALWRWGTGALLLLSAHQIVADKPSMWLLARELLACYEAFSNKRPSPLAPLPMQYADYARLERERLQGQSLEALLAYWRQQLADMPPMLVLPTDHPRPARQSYRGARQAVQLSRRLTEELRALSKREGVTLLTTLLAAFKTLLYRTSGQADISVGLPVAHRNDPALEHLVGPLANTLVLRSDLAQPPTFRALLRQVHAVTLDALAHQDLPFEKLVEALNPAHDPSYTPLFQVLFALDELPAASLDSAGLQVCAVELERGIAPYDLSLEMTENPQGLAGYMEYAADLFDAPTITRMLGHFQTLLEGVVANPDQSLLALPLLTAEERRQLLVEWNATQTDYPFDRLAHQLFEAQVERAPDAIAVVCENEQVSYQELNRQANRLARLLVKAGVGPDVVVALLAERGIHYLITMLAVFKAGGAYVPLDPTHPARRFYQVLSQSQSALVLTSAEFMPALSEALAEIPAGQRPPMLLIERLLQQEETAENLPLRCGFKQLAYVMYTSGSTGTPKGAMVNHLGMLNHNFAKIADLQITADSVVAQNGPQCFDIFVWQNLAALLVGGRVHIFKDEIAHHPRRLLEEAARVNISVLQLVPSMLRAIIQDMEPPGEARPALPALRWMVPTGDALPTELCRKWLTLYPSIPLLNTYGSTECSDDQCHYPLYKVPPDYGLPIMSIGRPIGNMRVYVLDCLGAPVPIGVMGELYVGGIGVGPGYLNDPARTAEVFLPDPFSQEPGARLYKTGDMARYLPDGTLEFIGRADHMVKIRGFRIEPGEIEAALEAHPAVQEVVVLAKAGPAGDKHLVAYVVPGSPYQDAAELPFAQDEQAGGHAAQFSAELRGFLKERLPDYMVPSAFILLRAMPLNANGKLDRKALPEPEITKLRPQRDFVAPRTPLEEMIAQMWLPLLGVERVSVTDDFFELGGHSLAAIQMLSRLSAAYRIELPLRSVFEAPTVAALAEKVEQKLIELIESLSEDEALRRLQAD